MDINKRKHLNSLFQTPGFTLIEIMVVVITLGVITSLALSNYNKVIEKSYCRNAQLNLLRIKSATDIARLKNKPVVFPNWQRDTLGITIDDSKFTYSWGGYSLGASSVAMRSGGPGYNCVITLGFPVSPTNPTCNSNTYCDSIAP